jgi:hypothetical protein
MADDEDSDRQAGERLDEITHSAKPMDGGGETRPTKGYWSKPNNYIRILTLLAVAIYTGFQIWQTHLIRSNNVVSQRAFISIRPIVGYISLDQSGQPAAANFPVDFVNNGNTGTRDLHALYKCAPSVENLQEPWSLLHQGPQLTTNTRFFVGPHSSEGGGCGFTFDNIQQMIQGHLFGYLLVDTSYYDRIDPSILHRTQMALRLTNVAIDATHTPLMLTYVSSSVGQHNCADEECPSD